MTNEVNQILLWYRYISLKITKKNFKKSIKLVMLGIFLLSNLGSVLEWDYLNIFANRNDSKEQRWFWIIWFFSLFESGYYWQCTTLTWQDKQCIDVAQTKNGYIIVRLYTKTSMQKWHFCTKCQHYSISEVVLLIERPLSHQRTERELKKYRPLVLFSIFGKAEKIPTFY